MLFYHTNKYSTEFRLRVFLCYAEAEHIGNTEISVKITVTLSKKPKAQEI